MYLQLLYLDLIASLHTQETNNNKKILQNKTHYSLSVQLSQGNLDFYSCVSHMHFLFIPCFSLYSALLYLRGVYIYKTSDCVRR